MGKFFDELFSYFESGGWIMPPMAVATIILWYALGYRYMVLKRGNARSSRVLITRYHQGYDREPRGIIDSAIVLGLRLAMDNPGSGRVFRRLLDDGFSRFEREIRRGRAIIRSIVSVAPLAGLLGTVIGMIETFDSLGDMALFSQSGGIAGGISQALFTTQMGLAVAVPGIIAGRILDRKQQRIEQELAQVKDMLCSEVQHYQNPSQAPSMV